MIFFVHIAKTAGSTMNRYLAENYRDGIDHCERYIADPTLGSRAARVDWMSGHVTLPAARAAFAPLQLDVRYVTCIRQPAAQIRSHYNWLAEIFYKSPAFYEAHPPVIKAISEQVRRTIANPTPAAVARDLRQHAGLFLNSQSRYFFGARIDPSLLAVRDADVFAALPTVREMVDTFDAIGDSGSIEALFNHVYGSERYSAGNRQRVNVSQYRFDPALFDSEEVAETIHLHSRLDDLLYGYLTGRMAGGLLVNRRNPAGVAALAAGPLT